MTKRKLYIAISLALVIISVLGFIFTTENKSSFLVLEKRGSSEKFEFEINLAAKTDYIFSFWAIDEDAGFKWATIDAYAEIVINDSVLHAKSVSFSESEEKGGIKRAQEGFNYNYRSEKSETAVFRGYLRQGDEWQIEVYENLTKLNNMKPGLFIILLLAALFIFMKARSFEK